MANSVLITNDQDINVDEIVQLLETAINSANNLAQVYTIQILGNVDEMVRISTVKDDGNSGVNQNIHLLMEHLVKSPLRRQAGRLKGLSRSLQVVVSKIQKTTTQQ